MHIERGDAQVDLFLLPHQDDEFAVFHLIESSVSSGRRPLIVYVTDGAFGRATSAVRNAESRRVLSRLGVTQESIWFLGQEVGVPNQGLSASLDRVYTALWQCVGQHGGSSAVASIYTTAWEGGHPDHDAAALLAGGLAKALNLLDRVYQFSLYNSYKCKLLPYSVFNPIEEAGSVINIPIPLLKRIKYMKLCWMYPSQLRTFIGLFPFIIKHYMERGSQQVQLLELSTLQSRPHAGGLLYERRGWLKWEDFEAVVVSFRKECEILPTSA